MKQFNFTFRRDLKMEGVEEHLLDRICGQLDSNTKDIVIKSTVEDVYKNFTTELENGIELDCEISWNPKNKEWDATVWQMGGINFENHKMINTTQETYKNEYVKRLNNHKTSDLTLKTYSENKEK